MIKLLLLPLLMLLTYTASAQAPTIEWQKSFGGSGVDGAQSIQKTTDGGYIVAGVSTSTDGDVTGNYGGAGGDYWIIKLDAMGNLQWQKSLGGSGDDLAHSIQQTTDGGYIVAGGTGSNDGDVSGNHGGGDYWVVKLDASGNLQWQRSLGGSGREEAFSIQQTTDGGYIAAGIATSTDGNVTGNHGFQDAWIVKLDATGNLQWQKSLGGSEYDFATSIQQTTDGGYIVAGSPNSTNGDVAGGHGGFDDYWVVKLDATGNLQWQKSLGGSYNDFAYSIQQTTDGGYIVAGMSGSNDGEVTGNHGGGDCWVVKLDATGNLQWQKSLGGSDYDVAFSIKQTTDGGYIMAGSSASIDGDVTGNHGGSDYWIVKLDATGNLQWQKSLGGSGQEEPTSIQQTTDGGYIVAGYSASTDGDVTGNHGDYDCGVVKLAPEPGVLPVTLYSFTATLKNTILLLQWTSTQEINAVSYEVERSRDGVHFTSLGNVRAAGNSSLTRNYSFTDEHPIAGINFYRLRQIGYDGHFTYSPIKQIRFTNQDAVHVMITPNPFKNAIAISFNIHQPQKVMATICDINGRLIKILSDTEKAAGLNQLVWNAVDESGNTMSSGIYFLKIETKNYTETKKIILIK